MNEIATVILLAAAGLLAVANLVLVYKLKHAQSYLTAEMGRTKSLGNQLTQTNDKVAAREATIRHLEGRIEALKPDAERGAKARASQAAAVEASKAATAKRMEEKARVAPPPPAPKKTVKPKAKPMT